MSIQGDIVSNPIVGTLASSALIVNNMSWCGLCGNNYANIYHKLLKGAGRNYHD